MTKSQMFAVKTPAAFVMFAILILISSVAAFGQKKQEIFVPNEVLVKFKPGRSRSANNEVASRLHSSVAEELGSSQWVRIRLSPGQTVDEAIKSFGGNIDVESVQPNYYYRLQSAPNDPRWSDLYGMVKISAPAAWDIFTGDSTVVVADIDTGFDYTHEDLAANAWTNSGEIPGNGIDDDGNGFVDDYFGYDFRFNDPDPMDENGHGTHTAGTIGAVGNNGLGVAGVAWHVKIMGIKIYDEFGDDTTSAMVVNASSIELESSRVSIDAPTKSCSRLTSWARAVRWTARSACAWASTCSAWRRSVRGAMPPSSRARVRRTLRSALSAVFLAIRRRLESAA